MRIRSTRFVKVAAAVSTAVLCVLALGSAEAGAATTHAWAHDGFDAGNTGFNPNETIINVATVASLENRWSITSPVVRAACARQTPPVVAGGRLFLGDEGGFAAYSAANGTQLWSVRFTLPDEEGVVAMAVAGTTLFVSTLESCKSNSDQDGRLTAYDVASGAVLWSVARDQPMFNIVTDKGVVVGNGSDASGGLASAYRVTDGQHLWDKTTVFAFTAVSAGGRVLLTTETGAALVDMVTGATVWSTGNMWIPLAATPDGTRFLVRNETFPNPDLLAVSATNGAVAWTQPGAGAAVAIDGTQVYALHQFQLSVFAVGNGAPHWNANLIGPANRPIVAGGVVYMVVEGFVFEFDASTGAHLDPGAPFEGEIGHVVVENGRLYATTGRVLDEYTP